jgi:hypothetical protein
MLVVQLDFTACAQKLLVGPLRIPGKISGDFHPCYLRRDAELSRGNRIKLGQRLDARAAKRRAPKPVQPLFRALVLRQVAAVLRIEKDFSVDETRAGHIAPRALNRAPATL